MLRPSEQFSLHIFTYISFWILEQKKVDLIYLTEINSLRDLSEESMMFELAAMDFQSIISFRPQSSKC